MPAGRPSSYTQARADAICERLVNGESLRTICRDPEMPAIPTVIRWLSIDPLSIAAGFPVQYACARDQQADTLADEIVEISDDARNDWMDRHGADGEVSGQQLNAEHIQRSRLRVDARKWYASKLAPKRYGDKQQHEVSAPGGGPVQTSVSVSFVEPPERHA